MTFSLSAPLFVEVAVPLPIDHPFMCGVPFGEEHRVQVGVRVLIPFGGQKMTGLVTAITDASALGGRDAKDLFAILDETPYVSERHLAFLSATARGCLAPDGGLLPPFTVSHRRSDDPEAAPGARSRAAKGDGVAAEPQAGNPLLLHHLLIPS